MKYFLLALFLLSGCDSDTITACARACACMPDQNKCLATTGRLMVKWNTEQGCICGDRSLEINHSN